MRRAHGRKDVALSLVLACMLMLCPRAFALNPALDVSQYAHTAWRVGEGVLQRPVVSIAQTPDGYLWLATEAGLLRFDGIRSVPWQPPSDQRLPSDRITSLLSARDGTLWIGTDRGLASWKGGRLNQYKELAGRAINKLVEDHGGVIWTAAGLGTDIKWVLCSIRDRRVECYGEDGDPGAGAIDIYEDTRGNLWVGTIGTAVERANGVWRWRPGVPRFYPLPPNMNGIQGLSDDDDGALLVSELGGIIRLDGGGAVMRYPFPPSMLQLQAARLLRDRDGSLWIGSTSAGLVHIHQGIRDVFAQPDGLSGDAIWTLFEDREGNIWVATLGGLDRFHDVTAATLSAKQGFSNSNTTSLLASRTGTIWVGTYDGLNKWDNGQVTVFRKRGTGKPVSPPEGARTVREINSPELPDGGVESVFEDSRGRVWLSTHRGIGYIENGRFISVPGLPGGVTRAIAEDHQSNVWVANQDLGLFRVAAHAAQIDRIPWANLDHTDAPTAMISNPSRVGLWLGFVAGGIVYFENGSIKSSYTTRDGLGEGYVRSFYFDRDGALWVSTDGGLSRVKNGRVITLSSKNGLPCDEVQWLLDDDVESFWLLTSCGLVRVAREEMVAWAAATEKDTSGVNRTVQTTVFEVADGVRTFSKMSAYTLPAVKSADGKLWFVSQGGVGVVDPRHLPFNKLPPPVHIEQIVADRKTYDTTSDTNGRVPLPALSRDLRIDYTALSLVAPEKVLFRYKLEGHDGDWQDVGTRRQAFYNDLPPGNYRFRVTASNNSGVWNETGAALDFSIAPAYYQTAWFRTLAVVMFLLLLWSAHRIRLRVIERHQADITALNEGLMKAQEQERTRIAGELHDGVMQQISALSLMLGTARRKIPSDLEVKAEIRDVQEKLIQVGTEVRQLSHDLHPSSLKDRGLPEALRAYCREFSRVRGLSVSCNADDNVGELSRGAALALYRISQEAIGNAATHGAAQHVDVRLTRSNSRVTLTVVDDGHGFDPHRIGASGGLGLINMRERARQLNGTFELDCGLGRGTTVRIAIPFRPAM